jgi:hypothetical protein
MAKKKKKSKTVTSRKWSAKVSRQSNALDLKQGIFASMDPRKIARSLKKSAEQSRKRKSSPYINRAGRELPARRKQVLQKAKDELRALFDKS